MKTLDDYIGENLDILSIGLNPSPPSVEAGIYFAGKRNRFWQALNGAGLIDEELRPSRASMQRLFDTFRIGFTDTVKRPTPGAGDLRRADFLRDVPLLVEKINSYRPLIAWFHGKVAYRQFLSVSGSAADELDWGLQPLRIGQSAVFVSPNPSPANAVFSLQDLIVFYRDLKALRDSLRKTS
ncbi:MAG: mismatch-specific DNA-glycosylase [Gammaproteobacteria bacterium]|nr:mismatch-specific DNA-glycosylase [Gammaproteobacteria bacterium]